LKSQNPDWGRKQLVSGKKPISVVPVFLGFFFLVLVFFGVLFWKGIPILGDYAAVHIPQTWEAEMGETISKEILASEKIDSARTEILRKFFGRLISENKDLPIQVYVIEKEEFNAFAVPGRKIFVYSGALSKIKTYPQLMALLGHEAGHVNGRHSVRTLFQSASSFALLSFFFGDLTSLSGLLLQNAHNLQNLGYSRDFEREADLSAHRFLCINEVDQEAIIGLMEVMEAETKGEQGVSILSSHPLTAERKQNAVTEIKSHPCGSKGPDPILQGLFEELKK